MKGRLAHTDEDYGDYITRCICTFTHDDGYMICCDDCSVWQHVECMKVDPKNLPDKYLCEECEPRPVDKKRAKMIQIKKKEEMSGTDFDDDESVSADDGHSRSGSSSPAPSKRRKRQQPKTTGTLRVQELKAEARRGKRDKEDIKKGKKKSKHHAHRSPSSPSTSMLNGVQTLLTAASALEQQLVPVSPPVSNSLWSSTSSPWQDPYDPIEFNHYTESFCAALSPCLGQLKQEAVVYTREEFQGLGAHPLCLVREVCPFRKGVVSEANIPEDEMIMEYKGTITTKQALLMDTGIHSLRMLWKNKPCPFVYQYDKMSEVHVCIDARQYGNSARFIRRSCSPNSELRHFFVDNKVHFGVHALQHISPKEEITIGFDFSCDKCDYPVECACGQKMTCLLATATPRGTRVQGGKRIPKDTAEAEIFHSEDSNQSRKSKGRGSITQGLDEDSNSSWLSNSSKRIKHNSTSQQASDSDSEDNNDSDTHQRRKSREERKTEAVWKMFEKMEATRRKRQQHLSSDSTHDNREMSPSSFTHNTSRTKERTNSYSGHKVQLLPSGKSRLASVSSVDLLSPEPVDFNSPPLTPSLSVVSLHDQTSNDYSSPPWSSLPKLSFEVTPYLHPKYLLADFALPRKKAILRQWEMEQLEPVKSTYSSHQMTNGFALACAKAMEIKKTRTRGSLKHRWIQRYSEKTDDDIMNHQNDLPIYHKKKFLQKWEENLCQSVLPQQNDSFASPQSPKDTPIISDSTTTTTIPITNDNTTETSTDKEDLTETLAATSQNELSDLEMDDSKQMETGSEPDTSVEQSSTLAVHNISVDTPAFVDIKSDPSTPQEQQEDKEHASHPSSPLFDDFSDDEFDSNETKTVSSNSEMIKPLKDLAKERQETIERQQQQEENSMQTDEAKTEDNTVADNNIHSIVTPPTLIDSPDPHPQVPTDTSTSFLITPDTEHDEQLNDDSIEMELSSTPPPPINLEVEHRPRLHTDSESTMEMSPVVASTGSNSDDLSKQSMDGIEDKPSLVGGAKRKKMSLYEYRNRSKKPSDALARKPTMIQESVQSVPLNVTLPSSTAVTCLSLASPSRSFLSFSSSFLSDPSKHLKSSGSPSHVGGANAPEGGPQFEPVSPDDESNTTAEDSSSSTSRAAVGSISCTTATSLTAGIMIGSGYTSYGLPQVAGGGATTPQFMWSGISPLPGVTAPATAIDMNQDPRRVQQSLSDMYPPSLHPQSMAPPSQSVVPPSLRYPSPYPPPPPPPPIMHPPPQIISHTTHDFMAAHQSRTAATGGFMSPRPPMLHPPGHAPRHAGNNYY